MKIVVKLLSLIAKLFTSWVLTFLLIGLSVLFFAPLPRLFLSVGEWCEDWLRTLPFFKVDIWSPERSDIIFNFLINEDSIAIFLFTVIARVIVEGTTVVLSKLVSKNSKLNINANKN